MQILLSNDDGIHSEGLLTLASVLREGGHDIWISAPDKDRSAFSHALSLRNPVKFNEIQMQTYSCSGTPADCIFYGLKGAIPVQPDVVIAGINKGYNVGTDIIYSGTAGAAREGALHKVPSFAVSAEGYEPPYPFQQAAEFVLEHIEEFIALWTPDIFININTPKEPGGDWEVSYPEHRDYGDRIEPFSVKKNEIYYFLSGKNSTTHEFVPKELSDMDALRRGKISVSPIHIHPTVDMKQYERFMRLHKDRVIEN